MTLASALYTIGDQVDGRYRVEELLGQGAMGAVFRVVDGATGRRLALKRLLASQQGGQIGLRFRREFHTIAGLAHPGIVTVHDFGIDDHGPYYTMELLEGRDLGELTTQTIVQVCTMMRQVAGALALLHAHRLLHRDLKPRNVRCTAEGKPKLIDFGVLATIGISGEVAGTPSSIPPEALRGLPLDGRSDLFGLGALTYWMLTGRHAFAASSIAELESVWSRDIAPPSAYREDVSPALDELVMSLLCLDPADRPRDAAEVVARFDAVAQLDHDPSLDVARGWITSAELVGRGAELQLIRSSVTGALASHGGAILIEGESGLGKTRLLREAGLIGQVAGAVVARARARVDANEPYAVVRRLAAVVCASCRADAQTALTGLRAAVRVVPGLAGLGRVKASTALDDPAEERLRGQSEIREWFRRLAQRRCLVLIIDDLQRCDEASAAVIAGLVHDAEDSRLLLCASVRSDETTGVQNALRSIRERADRVTLSGLDAGGVEALCRTLFGEAHGVERLARWMTQVAQGNPMHCTELARHLVEEKVLTYAQGRWQVPAQFDDLSLPAVLADAVEVRLGRLSPLARELAEVLSLLDGRASVGLCLSLLAESEAGGALDALRQLVFEEVLIEGERGVEFRHDALRETVRRKIAPAIQKELHLRLAQALDAASLGDNALHDQVGWHYLHGGENVRGAFLLEEAGRSLFEAQSFADAIRPLEAALQVWQDQPRTRKRCLELRYLLSRAGVICDRKVLLRHADEAIAGYSSDAGLDRVDQVRRILGDRLAVILAIGFAYLRWVFSRSQRSPPVVAVTRMLALVNYVATVHSLAFDVDPIAKLLARMRPFARFRRRAPGAAYLLVENFLSLASGDFVRVLRNANQIIEIIDGDRITPVADIDRALAKGAAQFMAASVLVLDQDPSYAPYVEALRSSKLRFFEISANNLEAFECRLRGDEDAARTLVERSELLAVQLGNAWVFRSQMAWIAAIAHGLTGDVLGLDRTQQELERFRDEGFRFEPWIAYVGAERMRLRGEHDACLELIECGLASLRRDELLVHHLLIAVRVDVLNSKGQYQVAIDHATRLLNRSTEQPPILRSTEVRLGCGLGTARGATGEVAGAREELNRRLVQADGMQNALMTGLVHEALMSVAQNAGEADLVRYHAGRAAAVFVGARSPLLKARGRKLLAKLDTTAIPGSGASKRPDSTSDAEPDAGAQATIVDEGLEDKTHSVQPVSPTEP